MDGTKLEHDIVADVDPHRFNNIEILPRLHRHSESSSHQHSPTSGGAETGLGTDGGSDLSYQFGRGQRFGPGSWRDSVGKVVPGPLTVLLLLESHLGKRI
jgi:hypothetical protein